LKQCLVQPDGLSEGAMRKAKSPDAERAALEKAADEFKSLMAPVNEIRDSVTDLRQYALDIASKQLKEAFVNLLSDFTLCERGSIWSEWIEAHAWLFWKYKGEYLQSDGGQLDDYMQAKRYLGYLIAETILAELAEKKSPCPLKLVSAERAKYLLPLSVEHFLRIRSYFNSIDRRRIAGGNESDRTEDDYETAKEYLHGTVKRLAKAASQRPSQCNSEKCANEFLQIHGDADPDHRELAHIKIAKRNTLDRLSLQTYSITTVNWYVDGLYHWLEDLSNKRAVHRPIDLEKAVREYPGMVNMFELLLVCPVSCPKKTPEKKPSKPRAKTKPLSGAVKG
jgi:hypothetical protein